MTVSTPPTGETNERAREGAEQCVTFLIHNRAWHFPIADQYLWRWWTDSHSGDHRVLQSGRLQVRSPTRPSAVFRRSRLTTYSTPRIGISRLTNLPAPGGSTTTQERARWAIGVVKSGRFSNGKQQVFI